MIYDFNDPEHFKKLEKQAYDGSIDVSGFPPAAYRYFDSLRKLYAGYKYDDISKDEAQAAKQKLLADYREASEAYELFCAVYRDHQGNIVKAKSLLSDIEKSHDVREIALIACECIGLMTGDREFAKQQAKKIMEEKL